MAVEVTPIRPKWKGYMTDRERFSKQMHFESFDRCFNTEFNYWVETFQQWPIFYENNITDRREADILFNFDRIAKLYPNNWLSPDFEHKVIEEKENTRIELGEDGLYLEVPKDGHSTIPHVIRASIENPDDWRRCKEERLRIDDPARKANIEEIKKMHPDDRDYPLGISCGSMIGRIRNILTFEGLAYACFDYPDMVEDMVETCCLLVEDSLDQLLPHIKFDYALGWEDICFKNGPIVTVDFFKNVVMPRYKRINKKLKAYGIDIWYVDCDGDITRLVPYFLEGGVNCMFPHEVNSLSHPAKLLNEYSGELRVMGGFDKMVLAQGPEAIKSYMESLVPLVERGGFIPHCDHFCPPNVKQEDYFYYLDLKEKMLGMK